VSLQDFARHGVQNAEERQKFTRLIKSISNGVDDPPFFGSGRHNGNGGLSSPELRGEIGGGILDLHSIDDSELLSEVNLPSEFQFFQK
jgi:kinesin family protein 2/24